MAELVLKVAQFFSDPSVTGQLVFGTKTKAGDMELSSVSLDVEAKEVFRREFLRRILNRAALPETAYKPADSETSAIHVIETSAIPNIAELIGNPKPDVIDFSPAFIKKIKFTAFHFQNKNKEEVIIFKAYPKTKFLSKQNKFKFTFKDKVLVISKEEIIVADPVIDCIVHKGNVLIINRYQFEKIFDYRKIFEEHAAKVFHYFATKAPYKIENLDEFKTSCNSDIRKLRKLSTILNSRWYQSLDLDKLAKFSTENKHIGVIVDVTAKVVKFADVHKFLHLYNDDYLKSLLTNADYVALNKKNI